LVIVYGFNIPKIVAEVRKKVASRLMEISGLVAKEINVVVASIEFPENLGKSSVRRAIKEAEGKPRPKVE
jgi:uncharacterized alkaline shock family protein YloU